MNKKLLAIVIAVLVILIGVSVYLSGQNQKTGVESGMPDGSNVGKIEDTPGMTGEMPAVSPTDAPQSATPGEKAFVVDAKNFSFAPSAITVNKGDKVKITLKNTGGFHDLKIDEYGVATPRINGGSEASIQFIADKTGTFEYSCSVGTHRQMGMKGMLIVK